MSPLEERVHLHLTDDVRQHFGIQLDRLILAEDRKELRLHLVKELVKPFLGFESAVEPMALLRRRIELDFVRTPLVVDLAEDDL